VTPMNAAEYQTWQFEYRLIDDALARIERTECGILTALGCSTDLAVVYKILNGEQKPPWPKRTATCEKHRAALAMHTLAYIAETRRHLALGQENPRLAARAALMVGLYAEDDAALNTLFGARIRERFRAGGLTQGAQIAKKAKGVDAAIAKWARAWTNSDELKEQYGYRSPTKHVRVKTKLPTRTIQRRLKKLAAAK
jgi:hypothetical protein